MFPDRAKWAPQGRRRRNLVPSGRVGSGSIGGRVMAPCDLRGILTTRLRSPVKMQRFEPSIDLDFANGFLEKKVVNLRFFLILSALFDEATGHRRNARIRAGGHLRGHLGFAKHFPGALASPQEPSGMENWPRDPWVTASPPQDRSSPYLQGILGKCAWGAVNMKRFWASNFTMQK